MNGASFICVHSNFQENEIPAFGSLRNGIAWKMIEKVGRGSSCVFPFPLIAQVRASWEGGTCFTDVLPAEQGSSYNITRDVTASNIRSMNRNLK